MKVKVAQSCLTLCNPMDYTDHGILQATILEWVSCPLLQLSKLVGELPNPGIELGSPALQVDSLPTKLSGKPIFPYNSWYSCKVDNILVYFTTGISNIFLFFPLIVY